MPIAITLTNADADQTLILPLVANKIIMNILS